MTLTLLTKTLICNVYSHRVLMSVSKEQVDLNAICAGREFTKDYYRVEKLPTKLLSFP